MPRILNIGSINIDYVYTVPHFVQAGETLAAASRQIFLGGKGLNQSVAMARAGSVVCHAGMVGNEGVNLLDILRDAGVDTNLIMQTDSPSGHTIIQVNPEGENCILLFPGANQELDEVFIDKAVHGFSEGDMLVLQNEVSCIAYAMQAAKAKGMRVVFNPSPFGTEIAGYPLGLLDYFLLNELEGKALTNKNQPGDILKTMGQLYPDAVIVLTLGEEGVLCLSKGKIFSHKSYKVDVIDTTAAGDTFSGYFISSLAEGKDIAEALEIASMAAAISVSRKGAAVSIPDLAEVRSFRNTYASKWQ